MTSQRKKFDMAGAEAFAQLSPIQSASYHYINDGFTDIPKAVLREYFTNELINQGAKAKYIDKVLATALAELSYPIPTNGDKYTWSGCQRAAYAGIHNLLGVITSYAKALILSLIQCVQMQTQQAVRYNYK